MFTDYVLVPAVSHTNLYKIVSRTNFSEDIAGMQEGSSEEGSSVTHADL